MCSTHFILHIQGHGKILPRFSCSGFVFFFNLVELSRQLVGKASLLKQFGERVEFCPFSKKKNI